jgi:hypothetical protein
MGIIFYALGYIVFPFILFFIFMYLSRLTTRE